MSFSVLIYTGSLINSFYALSALQGSTIPWKEVYTNMALQLYWKIDSLPTNDTTSRFFKKSHVLQAIICCSQVEERQKVYDSSLTSLNSGHVMFRDHRTTCAEMLHVKSLDD